MRKQYKFLWLYLLLVDIIVVSLTASCGQAITPVPTAQPSIKPVDEAISETTRYYTGVIIITEYYTLLSNELPREAYKLLSASAQSHSPNLDEYAKLAALNFQTIEIITIEPLIVWQQAHGALSVAPDQEDQMRFYVQIKAWGKGEMSGSVRSGDLQTLLLTLIKDDKDWKIDSFATGLITQTPQPIATSSKTSP